MNRAIIYLSAVIVLANLYEVESKSKYQCLNEFIEIFCIETLCL